MRSSRGSTERSPAGRGPKWVAEEERLVTVARLVRAYDDAGSFGPPQVADSAMRPGLPGTPAALSAARRAWGASSRSCGGISGAHHSYGLHDVDRSRLVPTARNLAERSWHPMRDRAQRPGGGWQRPWDGGVGDRILHPSRGWSRRHHG